MKRILIFFLSYYPHVGGAEVALKEITDRIADIEFHMVTMNFGGQMREEKIGNVMVHRVGNNASYFSKILFAWKAIMRTRTLDHEYHFDIVYMVQFHNYCLYNYLYKDIFDHHPHIHHHFYNLMSI